MFTYVFFFNIYLLLNRIVLDLSKFHPLQFLFYLYYYFMFMFFSLFLLFGFVMFDSGDLHRFSTLFVQVQSITKIESSRI